MRAVCGILALGFLPFIALAGDQLDQELPKPRLVVDVVPKAGAPLYPGGEPMPIDLPTVLRLADASNPTIAIARARVREAYARLDQANLLWLPNLDVGSTYLRHDGQIQRTEGPVITVSKGSIFVGGGPEFRWDSADLFFLPLIARRLSEAERAGAQAVSNNVQLDAALAYLDLLEVYGLLAVNADTLARAEQTFKAAQSGDKAGLNKNTADINRAATEVGLRRQEAIELRGRVGVASAHLGRLLLLRPDVDLHPAEPTIVPLFLVPGRTPLGELIDIGEQNRPELAANRSVVGAAETRVRQARVGPFLPKVQVDYLAGGFGGGVNDDVSNFNGRGDLAAQAYWEFKNLGLGNAAQVRERRAQLDQAQYRFVEVQAQVAAEVTEAARIASARFTSLEVAQKTVLQAVEMYRKLSEASFGMAGPRPMFDALEPLLAIQALNQARVQYLRAVVDFNRAQFQLYTALGQPPFCAEPTPQEVTVPVAPIAVRARSVSDGN